MRRSAAGWTLTSYFCRYDTPHMNGRCRRVRTILRPLGPDGLRYRVLKAATS